MYIYIYVHTVDTIDEFVNLCKPTHITGGGISWDFSRWFFATGNVGYYLPYIADVEWVDTKKGRLATLVRVSPHNYWILFVR